MSMPEPFGDMQNSPPPPPRRRRWQFSLATLLIVVTIAAVIARWLAQPEPWPKFQQRFAAVVNGRHGDVFWGDDSTPHFVSFGIFEHMVGPAPPDDTYLKRLRPDFARLGPFSLRLPLCTDSELSVLSGLRHLQCLSLPKSHRTTDASVEHLANMPGLQFVDVTGTQITADGIAGLQTRRPDVVVWSSIDRLRSMRATKKTLLLTRVFDEAPSWKIVDNVGRAVATLERREGIEFPEHAATVFGTIKLLALSSGDAIAFGYHDTSDSGVDLARLAIADERATIAWAARSEPLGVAHSKYRHEVTLRIHQDKLLVHSAGSFGTFVELRDLETGALLKRWRY